MTFYSQYGYRGDSDDVVADLKTKLKDRYPDIRYAFYGESGFVTWLYKKGFIGDYFSFLGVVYVREGLSVENSLVAISSGAISALDWMMRPILYFFLIFWPNLLSIFFLLALFMPLPNHFNLLFFVFVFPILFLRSRFRAQFFLRSWSVRMAVDFWLRGRFNNDIISQGIRDLSGKKTLYSVNRSSAANEIGRFVDLIRMVDTDPFGENILRESDVYGIVHELITGENREDDV